MMLTSSQIQASSLLELGKSSSKKTIVSIGSVPEKKAIPLNLGLLRTDEAQLPPPPLTRQERMMLRAKRAVSRQTAVTNARRQRVAQRQDEYDETEEFPVDGNGDPILE